MSFSDPPEPGSERQFTIGIALKWVPHHVEVDPLAGTVQLDSRLAGASRSDLAALELGLSLGEAWNARVTVVSAGKAQVEPMLRAGLAAGASRAVRCDLDEDLPSKVIAAALAGPLSQADLIICGDRSIDRGSGSVPAFVAAILGVPQGLGLVSVEIVAAGVLEGLRRLDGGRRERVRVSAPAVISVEGSVARLRRATLGGIVGAKRAAIEIIPSLESSEAASPSRLVAYRPPTRVVSPPPGDLTALQRIMMVAGVSRKEGRRSEMLTLPPEEAAERILRQLREWGYLD